MCIINSCQPDIKICFFSLLPTLPQEPLHPTSMAHVLFLWFQDFFAEFLGGQLFCKAMVCLLHTSHYLPAGMEGAYVGGARAAVKSWAFPGGGEGFITGIVGTEGCRRGHYQDPWRLKAGEHGCTEKKRSEKSFDFMRAWVWHGLKNV